MGSYSPQPGRRGGRVQLQLLSPLPHLHTGRGGGGGPPAGPSRSWALDRPRVPGKSEPNGPEGGKAAGGRGAGRQGNRKEPSGEGVPSGLAPYPPQYHTPEPRRGREVPASEEAELTPRSSSERKSGPSSRPSCGGSRARRAREEYGVGEIQRETLVPGQRGPRALPEPATPTARPELGAAEHPPSRLRRSDSQRRRARHRGPEGAGGSEWGGGAGPRISPAPPRPPRPRDARVRECGRRKTPPSAQGPSP